MKQSSKPIRPSTAYVLVRFQEGLRRRRHKRIRVSLSGLRAFSENLRRQLRLRRRTFDLMLVDDPAITILNRDFRGRAIPTDVLSFPFSEHDEPHTPAGDLDGFLGDIVISLDTAQRNAAEEKHSLLIEVQQLVLHGALHLLGYDHETDHGEMNALELNLRRTLKIEGR